VRENTLKVFAETYTVLRDDVWRLLGKEINPKVKGLLEQRFKQVGNKLGSSSKPGNDLGRSIGGKQDLNVSSGPKRLGGLNASN
jgi:hypothetical protein